MTESETAPISIQHSSFNIHHLILQKGGDGNMNERRKVLATLGAWVAGITGAHLTLNVDWKTLVNDYLPKDQRKLNVAYIPVT